jgi:hypothetical protein
VGSLKFDIDINLVTTRATIVFHNIINHQFRVGFGFHTEMQNCFGTGGEFELTLGSFEGQILRYDDSLEHKPQQSMVTVLRSSLTVSTCGNGDVKL